MIPARRQLLGRAAASLRGPRRTSTSFWSLGVPSGWRGVSSESGPARKKANRTTVDFEDLPSSLVDSLGQPVKPLEALEDAVQRRGRVGKASLSPVPTSDPSSGATVPQTDEDAYAAALASGAVPKSPLAKEVFLNWRRFPDCIVLTRVGKFYEVSLSATHSERLTQWQSYFSPAIKLSQLLSLKLAYKRYSEGVFPFSGFPVHQLDKYLKILVQDLGHTVVLVEEYDEDGNKELLEPVRKKQGGSELKERKVGRVVTPGTLVDESWLAGEESRYLLSIALEEPQGREGKLKLALAYTDASTGDFFLKSADLETIEDELARIAPREIVLDQSLRSSWESSTTSTPSDEIGKLFDLIRVMGVYISFADPFTPPSIEGTTQLSSPMPVKPSLDSLAIALLRHHLQYALRDEMPDLDIPTRQSSSNMMQIDAATLHALEIRHAVRPSGMSDLYGPQISLVSTRGTLLSVVGRTVTPGGHRLLVRTLTAPSTDIGAINSRLDLVEAFTTREELRLLLREMLRSLVDVRRIVQRFKGRRGDGQDAWDVARWIRATSKILDTIREELKYEASSSSAQFEGQARLTTLLDSFQPLGDLALRLEESIDEERIMQAPRGEEEGESEGMEEAADAMLVEDKPKNKKEKETRKEQDERRELEREAARFWMRPSFSEELADLHTQLANLKERKDKMQASLREKYDVGSLVLKKNRNSYIMTLTSKSEFAKIDKSRRFASVREGTSGKTYVYNDWSALGAKTETHIEDMMLAQRRAFSQLREIVVEHAPAIVQNAELLDELDLGMGFAQVAVDNNYVRPLLNDSTNMEIINARHPVVESSLQTSSRIFTSNSTSLTPNAHLHIITGPNQGGKSTLLRQTAIIAILAQSGCYVPADRVEMGVVDKVFSRIGARDDLYRDRSTFMLEMVETAAILRHATPRSLVIMDEIGRGTTLNSGLSIAYATLDYILNHIKCRTLFATHYHELASMLSASPSSSKAREGVAFWCTDVDEIDGAFSYSYKLRPGINYRSHAIKAARMAGMPESFISTAEETLRALDPVQLDPAAASVRAPASSKVPPKPPKSYPPLQLHDWPMPLRPFIPSTTHESSHVASK